MVKFWCTPVQIVEADELSKVYFLELQDTYGAVDAGNHHVDTIEIAKLDYTERYEYGKELLNPKYAHSCQPVDEWYDS